jgi:glycerol-3-phosphate O-acyltransferase
VDAWLATRPGVLQLPRDERLARLKELADEVMRRIAAIMPVTPVPLAATALLRHPGERITRAEWEKHLDRLRDSLRGAGAHVVGEERASAEILDRALVMFTLRRVVSRDGNAFRIDRGQDALLRYYAGSIAHFFDGGPG